MKFHAYFFYANKNPNVFLGLQVYLGSEGALDVDGKELPRLVYVSREKRPGYQHHKKAGAMNALVSVSSPASNH